MTRLIHRDTLQQKGQRAILPNAEQNQKFTRKETKKRWCWSSWVCVTVCDHDSGGDEGIMSWRVGGMCVCVCVCVSVMPLGAILKHLTQTSLITRRDNGWVWCIILDYFREKADVYVHLNHNEIQCDVHDYACHLTGVLYSPRLVFYN